MKFGVSGGGYYNYHSKNTRIDRGRRGRKAKLKTIVKKKERIISHKSLKTHVFNQFINIFGCVINYRLPAVITF